MDFQKIKDFIFNDLFADYTNQDSIVFGVCTFIAFLIGFIIAALAASRKKRKLRKELKEVKHELNNTKAELVALQEQYELKTAALQKAELMAEDLSGRVEILESEKGQLHTDLYNANEEVERLNASTQSYASTVDDLNNQIIGLKTKSSEYEENAKNDGSVTFDGEAAAQISEMQNSYSATLDRLGSLEEKLNQLDIENEMLKADLDKMKSGTKLVLSEPAPIDTDTSSTTKIINADADTTPLKERIVLTTEQLRVKALIEGGLPAADGQKDDLTLINGVGPFLEKKLNNIGICTYEQISKMDAETIEEVTEAIEFFPGRIEKDDWVGQANRLLGRGDNGNIQARVAAFPSVKEVAEPKINIEELNEASVEEMEAEMLDKETQASAEAVSKVVLEEAEMLSEEESPDSETEGEAEIIVLGSQSTEEVTDEVPTINPFGNVKKDDLKVIEGIGPKISIILTNAGIYTWKKLSESRAEDIKEILASAGNRFKIHDPSTWPQQAEFAAKGNWVKLKEYQDYLVGGKDMRS